MELLVTIILLLVSNMFKQNVLRTLILESCAYSQGWEMAQLVEALGYNTVGTELDSWWGSSTSSSDLTFVSIQPLTEMSNKEFPCLELTTLPSYLCRMSNSVIWVSTTFKESFTFTLSVRKVIIPNFMVTIQFTDEIIPSFVTKVAS
jgi:hypothetical protein